MKEFHTLNLDLNNYVLSIAHTSNDNTELDLSTIDLAYLNAYQYLDGELVLDEVKLKELKDEEDKRTKAEEITRLKQELANTDYQIIKCSECQLLGQPMPYDVAELHAQRQAIRYEINKLEE